MTVALPLPTRMERIGQLRKRIKELVPSSSKRAVPTGADEIDALLPAGGLKQGALHEVAAADHRAQPAAFGLLLALVRTILAAHGGPLLWPFAKQAVYAFGTPYGPGLRFFGIDPEALILVRCASPREALWSMAEGLRLGGLGAVAGMRVPRMNLAASRRLQLAAESSATPVFLLRPHDDAEPSAAVTRWRVAPAACARDRFGFFRTARWHVSLERARGAGRLGEWMVEWDHDALRLRLSSVLAGRALPQDAERRCA